MSVDIVAENAKLGTYSFSEMQPGDGYGDIAVAGFSRKISYNIGETAQFCVTGAATVIHIFRVGWYQGKGFRQVDSIVNTPVSQPEGSAIAGSYGATTQTAWSVTASWAIPEDAVSGIYMAMIRNAGNTNAFYVTFVVRDDAAVADIVYKTSDATWAAAYNNYGLKSAIQGSNLYGKGTGVGNIMDRSVATSYHRPVITRGGVIQTYWWACELPLIRFLERNGYSVKYISSVDLDKNGAAMLNGKASVFLSSGHDEYWTTNMRNAIEQWRDVSGGHSIFMSGNEVFWKARYEYIGDEAILWCYKDTMPGPSAAPTRTPGSLFDPIGYRTGTWKDTRDPLRKPEWFLTGTDFGMNGIYDYDVTVPKNPYGGLKVWGGSSLVDSDITITRILGFEGDHAHPTQPAGSFSILAAYTRSAPGGLSDANGQNYNVPGNIEWGIVAQRYASGALTVGFGTCQWAWALDVTHDRTASPVSVAAQIFTVNLLNDLGADPQTLMAGILLRTKTPLNQYGVIPGGPPVDPEEPEEPTDPQPPVDNGRYIYLGDGRILSPFMLKNGILVPLEVTV